MTIKQFLNLEEKKVNNDIKDIISNNIKAYSIGDRIHKINKKDIIIPKVWYFKKMQALYKLYFYKE